MKIFQTYFLLFFTLQAYAEINPKNESVLNYTYVMFEYEVVKNATKYEFVVQDIDTKKNYKFSSTKNIYYSKESLEFAHSYQWNVTAYIGTKKIAQSVNYHFSIGTHPNIQKDNVKFTINKIMKDQFQNDILFIDHLGIAINRKGVPVWYLPERVEKLEDKNNFRTLQMTPSGTITFMYNSNCYETDLEGNELWKAPKAGVISEEAFEEYHHDFAKLPHGNYLTCSYKYNVENNYYNQEVETRIRYATLIEYDKNKKIVWSWYEKNHVDKSILFQNESANSTEIAGTHMNGFVFSKNENALFLSFRNSSQVYKIDYVTGKVLAIMDGKADLKQRLTNVTFFQQHGPSLTKNGDVVIYNNNINPFKKEGEISFPKVLILKNPKNNVLPLQKIWEYECTWDKKPQGIEGKEGFAKELDNENILVNIGGAERIFEVTKTKKIVWDCSTFKFNPDSAKFLPFSNYRCYSTKTLYPIYFSIYEKNNDLVIDNIGNDDSYEITFFDKKEELIYNSIQTKMIASGKQILIPKNKDIKTDYSVIVKSKTNPFLIRKLRIAL